MWSRVLQQVMDIQYLPRSTFLIDSMAVANLRESSIRPFRLEALLKGPQRPYRLAARQIKLDLEQNRKIDGIFLIPGGRWLLASSQNDAGGNLNTCLHCWDLLELEKGGQGPPSTLR